MRFRLSNFLGLTIMVLGMGPCRAEEPQNMRNALNDGYRVSGFAINKAAFGYTEEMFVLTKDSSLILCSYNGTDQTEEFCNRLN